MKTYEVTVKLPPVYGRDGAGTWKNYKVNAGGRGMAAKAGINLFAKEVKGRDSVGSAVTVTIVRVL